MIRSDRYAEIIIQYADLKENVLSLVLKQFIDVVSLTSWGRLFQMVGAAWLKAREAIFVRIDGTTRESGVDEHVCRTVNTMMEQVRKIFWLLCSQSSESNNSQLILYPVDDR